MVDDSQHVTCYRQRYKTLNKVDYALDSTKAGDGKHTVFINVHYSISIGRELLRHFGHSLF